MSPLPAHQQISSFRAHEHTLAAISRHVDNLEFQVAAYREAGIRLANDLLAHPPGEIWDAETVANTLEGYAQKVSREWTDDGGL